MYPVEEGSLYGVDAEAPEGEMAITPMAISAPINAPQARATSRPPPVNRKRLIRALLPSSPSHRLVSSLAAPPRERSASPCPTGSALYDGAGTTAPGRARSPRR